MPRPRKNDREEMLSETRQRLLDAAAVEFAHEGYVGANINRISQAAGFAKGTIYNYFPSKRALMLALIDRIAAAHVDFILHRVQQEPDFVRRLGCFFSAGFAFVEQQPVQAAVVINTVYSPDEEFKARVFAAYERLFGMIFQDIVGAGIARGDFRPMDPDLATAMLMSIYLGSCALQTDGKIGVTPDQVLSFVLEGLHRREPSPVGEKGSL